MTFRAVVRPLDERLTTKSVMLGGQPVDALVGPNTTDSAGFSRSYEAVAGDLEGIPRLFLEPDGAMVWVSPVDPERETQRPNHRRWSAGDVCRAARHCGWEEILPVLTALGWPDRQLMFQWLPESVLLSESAFRGLIETHGG